MNVRKFDIFEAFVLELMKKENNIYKYKIKFNKERLSLEVLHLLFISVSRDKKLLEIFDNFISHEIWGPMEGDIRKTIGKDGFKYISFKYGPASIKNGNIVFSKEDTEIAKQMVDNLKKRNKGLLKLSLLELEKITKNFTCWTLTQNFNIKKIELDLILKLDESICINNNDIY